MPHRHVTTICRHLARTPSANLPHVRISDKPMSVGAIAIKSVKLFRGGRVGDPPPPPGAVVGGRPWHVHGLVRAARLSGGLRPSAIDRPTDPSLDSSFSCESARVPRVPVSCDTTPSLVCSFRANWLERLVCPVRLARSRRSIALYHANRLRRGPVHRFLNPSTEFSARRVVARCAWMLSIFRNGHVSGDSVVCVGRLRARWHRTVELHASSFKPPPLVRGQSGSCVVYLS